MADKYYRLVCFLVNITPQPLRMLFLKYMRTDPKLSTCSTIDACLKSMKQRLYILKKKTVIRQAQWELLFPSAPGKAVDETSWDITLVILLIEDFYGNKLQQVEEDAISKIRGIRNRLQHFAETSLDDADFDNMWTMLECATIDIAKQIQPSPMYVNDIKECIDETKINNMPNLGDSLRYFYETIIIQMKSDMEDMKEIMAELAEKCNESQSILRHTTEKRVGPTGEKVKRMKTVDHILKRLTDNFTTSMKEDLPNNFVSPPEVADIKTKLRDVHHVVVTGSRGSRYIEAALASLKSMDYNHNRCVEMKNSCDWRHIDPGEVDLVLCREPFGDYVFDKDKTKSMADIFSSMLQVAKISERYKNIDIVIVSEKEILQEVLKFTEHDLLQEVVEVYQPTTESDPADLTGTCDNFEMDFDQTTRNQLDLTAVFVERYRDDNLHPASVVDDARTTFKRDKVIVITGPRKCGKTTLAVTLASRYQKNQFMVLIKPDDRKLIRLGSICTVLVEDFAGKNSYNGTYAEAWLREFELLFSAVCSGKLNLIITCEKKKLLQCNEENGPHPILKNTFVLEHVSRTVKQELTCPDAGDTSIVTRTVQSCSFNMNTNNNFVSDGQDHVEKSTHSSDAFNNIRDTCPMNESATLCLNSTGTVLKLDKELDVEATFLKEQHTAFEKICCLHDNMFLLVNGKEVSIYELKSNEIHLITTANLDHESDFLAKGKTGMITILNKNIIYEYLYDDYFELQFKKLLPMKPLMDSFVTGASVISDRNCVIIVKPGSFHSIRYKEKRAIERVLYIEENKIQPVAVCAGKEVVFILCLTNNHQTKVLKFGLDLEQLGTIRLDEVAYNPFNVSSMVYDLYLSRLLITYSGKLDAFTGGFQLADNQDIESPNTSSYNRVKEIQTHTINIPENMILYRMTQWCQHPDGSFLYLANIRVSSVDDDEDDSIYTFQRKKTVIIHISSDFEYQCCYNTDLDELSYTTNHICCTDTGGVVISVSNQINWYRLSNGSLQFIKSTKFYMGFSCSSISFFKNKIYCFSDEISIILDTNLNIKRRVEHMEAFLGHILPCSFKKYISISDSDFGENCIICEDSKLKQLKYLRTKGFIPLCMCAATEDSVFLFGIHGKDFRILQVNNDLTVQTDIFVDKKEIDEDYMWHEKEMVFDQKNSRLVIPSDYDELTFHTIYLE